MQSGGKGNKQDLLVEELFPATSSRYALSSMRYYRGLVMFLISYRR